MAAMSAEPTATAAPLLRTEKHASGLASVTLEGADRASAVAMTPARLRDLVRAVDALENDPEVVAIVVQSGAPDSFVVGTDIEYLQSLRFAKDGENAASDMSRAFARIARGKKPVVACVHGRAMGSGFELALACTATVASDAPITAFGFHEVKLGLMPAGNGLFRVAERAGLRAAIDLGLSGRSLRAERARSLGLVDEVVAEAIVRKTAGALALRLAREPKLRKLLPKTRIERATSTWQLLAARMLIDHSFLGKSLLFRRARANAREETRGHYPAAEYMLDVLERFGHRGFGAAAKTAARLFGELVVSETAHRLLELFVARTAMKEETGPHEQGAISDAPHATERVAIFGAGLMGAGIAAVTVQAGIATRMKDRDDAHVGRGLRWVKEQLDRRERSGAMTALERDQAFARLEGTVDDTGFHHADVVIEAVYEDLSLKHEILREIEGLVSERCVIASNTASLPITKIAEVARHPERVLGMHYFRPATRIRFVEIVRTKHTDPRAIKTAVELGKRQGKSAIVVDDGTGFYSTRILTPFLNEALCLLEDGVPIDLIDEAIVDWGFPVGPFRLLDEIGIDFAGHVAQIAYASFGERMRPADLFVDLAKDDRKGRKNARGFYFHRGGVASAPSRNKDKPHVDDTVYRALSVIPKRRVTAEEIQLRCSLRMVNEALRCLDEGILRSARDGDIAAVLGLGFPPFRGGPFRYVDVLGANEVLRRTRSLEQRLGERFEPAPMLVDMARTSKRCLYSS